MHGVKRGIRAREKRGKRFVRHIGTGDRIKRVLGERPVFVEEPRGRVLPRADLAEDQDGKHRRRDFFDRLAQRADIVGAAAAFKYIHCRKIAGIGHGNESGIRCDRRIAQLSIHKIDRLALPFAALPRRDGDVLAVPPADKVIRQRR